MSYNHGPGPVPERWLRCPRKSLNLIGGKFLAIKTPLSVAFDSQIEPGFRFTPAMLFSSIKSNKWEIGLWIDLTNTKRFYDMSEVIRGNPGDKEVAYVKIQCRGHGETPTREHAEQFINLCRTFIEQHPLQIIAVHCTHGFNRTGFLIISYLVEEMDYSVDAALREFARWRSPGIYKDDYIKELYRRYQPDERPPAPPVRPPWCYETDRADEDFNEEVEESSHTSKRKSSHPHDRNKKRSKRQASNPVFMDGVPGVHPLYDQKKVQHLQMVAQKMCGSEHPGFPGAQPVSMDLMNIQFLKEKPYSVSWKADGTRYMMLILGENEVYFLDRDNNVFEVKGMTFVYRKDTSKHLFGTLLDGEMVIDRHEGTSLPRYLIYDIIYVSDIDVKSHRFSPERMKIIEKDVMDPRNMAVREGKIDKLSEPFSVRLKSFFSIEKTESYLSDKFNKQLSHDPDGLIFQPCDDPYVPGPCPNVLKWKPPSLNSVDFRLKLVTEKGLGMLPRTIGELYVGRYNQPFASIDVKKLKAYDGKIIECKFENKKWVFMRERTDKSFPNSHSTAMSVCNSILHPVTKEILLDLIAKQRYRSDEKLMPPPSRQPSRHVESRHSTSANGCTSK